MRKTLSILLALCLIIGMAACSGEGTEEAEDKATATEAAEEQAEQPEESGKTEQSGSSSGNKTLVVYFSATGNTRAVAEKIASITGADTYEIKAAKEYTEADLDWNDSDSRTTREQNDPSARPKIGSDPVSLEGYSTIYLGYPIWWGQEPRIMDSFVEAYDFAGITVIPFCTSSSSGIGSSGKNLADNAGSGDWLQGERFSGGASESELKSWIEGLK